MGAHNLMLRSCIYSTLRPRARARTSRVFYSSLTSRRRSCGAARRRHVVSARVCVSPRHQPFVKCRAAPRPRACETRDQELGEEGEEDAECAYGDARSTTRARHKNGLAGHTSTKNKKKRSRIGDKERAWSPARQKASSIQSVIDDAAPRAWKMGDAEHSLAHAPPR